MDRGRFWSRRILVSPTTWGKNSFKSVQWYNWMQKRLKKISETKDRNTLSQLEHEFYEDPDMKIYALRRCIETGLVSKDDQELLRTDKSEEILLSQMDWRNYHCEHPKEIKMIFHTSGRERTVRVPSIKDQAMEAMVSFYLKPIVESYNAHGSRNVFEIETDILELLKGSYEYALEFSVKVINSEHYLKWIKKNVPIEERILDEFIRGSLITGRVLYPEDQYSLRLGTTLANELADFCLDSIEFNNNDTVVIRYNEKYLILSQNKSALTEVKTYFRDHFLQRGCNIIPETVHQTRVNEGFIFLSKFYKVENKEVQVSPSEEAKDGLLTFINDILWNALAVGLQSWKEVIMDINAILKIWRNYHQGDRHEFLELDRKILQIIVSEGRDQSWTKTYKEIMDDYRMLGEDGNYHPNFPHKTNDLQLFELSSPILKREHQAISRHYYRRELSCCALCGRQIYYRTPAFQINTGEDEPNLKLHQACADNIYETILRLESGNAFYEYDYKREWECETFCSKVSLIS